MTKEGIKEEIAADFLRMYKELTDPEHREEQKRKAERAERLKQRQLDTGYVF